MNLNPYATHPTDAEREIRRRFEAAAQDAATRALVRAAYNPMSTAERLQQDNANGLGNRDFANPTAAALGASPQYRRPAGGTDMETGRSVPGGERNVAASVPKGAGFGSQLKRGLSTSGFGGKRAKFRHPWTKFEGRGWSQPGSV